MLIIILEVDTLLVGTPMYSSFQSKYDELKLKLEEREEHEMDDEEPVHDVGDYGIENLEVPTKEKQLLNKWWVFGKFMHILILCFYLAATVFDVFKVVKIVKKEV